MTYKLLLVEDDPSLGYVLSEYLLMKGFRVQWVKNAEECLLKLNSNRYDLAILDVMLPDTDGFELAKKIQEHFAELPFLFLTARGMKIDVLKGFAMGAVDYLKKPIDEEELVVRIRTLLQRLSPVGRENKDVDGSLLQIGKYTLNRKNQELLFENKVHKLTQRENELLTYLALHKNQLCSHRDILIQIWGENDYFNRKSLNVFVTHLRKYLRQDPSVRIENVHGGGFILKTDTL
ncbi:response regulator transcription factor [Arenibacter sp. GZD96]|uniref:response regulator transcription factor n=1 Tax=Aurantibrevibacter litoralis TaxID=3106030 RepID=UPI002AFEB0BB|nr:response regulator transcription factor [Arenibacter sp. GZD-96]MEA1786860.1 response regulator transcription factor [Arenibacter sp. GZD-96]